MKILVIEDNRTIAYAIRRQLANTHIVEIAGKGESGLQKVYANTYAVIILDLSLPDKNGLEVCKEIRKSDRSTPILVLTGTDTIRSRVELLEAGADDYLTKPFNSEELSARILALSRRRSMELAENNLTVKDLTIDTIRREVMRSGEKIDLRRKEYDILNYLVLNRGRAVSREMIMNHVWESGKESWNNTIDVHIKHLRGKIDTPYAPSLITTVYGIGYMVDDSV